MYVLGINGGVRAGYQDVSAVLVKNGEVVFAIAEERLNRRKHSAGQLPYLSVLEALKFEGIQMEDIDFLATHGSTFEKEYETILDEFYTYTFGYCPPIRRVHHHLAHAASAFYGSNFDQAMILTIDASGDGIAIQKAVGKGYEIRILEQASRTNSLGIFYSIMTQFCGFTRDTDEYKLMGLAPYGTAGRVNLNELIETNQNGVQLNSKFIKQYKAGSPQGSRQQAAFNKNLVDLLGQPRMPQAEISQYCKDVAWAAQQKLSEAVIGLVRDLHKQTGLKKLCLAGGVALNCETNRLLTELDFIEELFVQPASGDDGISLGAAWLVSQEEGIKPIAPSDYYLGKSYSNQEIKEELELLGVSYKTVDYVAEEAAKLVGKNKVIGWFQGRDEFGPRALGNRSILAQPLLADMKATLNEKIKFRESFRPFAPTVKEENFKSLYKSNLEHSPYMTINCEVQADNPLKACTHADQTSRVQTLNEQQNPSFYHYLNALEEEIGIGATVNTSFNRKGEPMVQSPKDAVSAFYGSGLDALFIGNYQLLK